ncbi:FixH family protein [Sphingomonas qomolangmaensis]|uniref:FixH family protein n=1 Tax=Sphingomonas qomolangmaensis TaxID=2918765 RepID=A0ABY5LE79_9SPHN|nr:FixH family protein [Sphingomonas qomolangmaensis]UUL84044.1 FixH family protein [Sphingomonas qomolangmaensis]
MTKPFTGWHMTAIMVAFFAVVVTVNVIMATQASHTFGGVVVENSYVASQRFNGWLGEARAQARLGWSVEASGEPGGVMAVDLRGPDGPVDGAAVVVMAEHPLGRVPATRLALAPGRDGRYAARHALLPGRWILRIAVQRGETQARFKQEIML